MDLLGNIPWLISSGESSAFQRHAIVERLTVGVAAHVAQCDVDDAPFRHFQMVAARHMRGDETARFMSQWRVGRQRFRFGHVEAGTP